MRKPLFLKSQIKNPHNTSYEGKDRDEEIKILIRQSMISTLSWLFTALFFFVIPFFLMPFLGNLQYKGVQVFTHPIILSFTIFWYIALFGYVFQCFLNWYFEVLLVTNKKIVDIDKGCTNISETTLTNVQDVTSKMASVLGQIFNIGSIHIQTAAEREEFEFHLVDNPSAIRDTISDMVAMKENTKNEP